MRVGTQNPLNSNRSLTKPRRDPVAKEVGQNDDNSGNEQVLGNDFPRSGLPSSGDYKTEKAKQKQANDNAY